jgi:hypothetical protein
MVVMVPSVMCLLSPTVGGVDTSVVAQAGHVRSQSATLTPSPAVLLDTSRLSDCRSVSNDRGGGQEHSSP